MSDMNTAKREFRKERRNRYPPEGLVRRETPEWEGDLSPLQLSGLSRLVVSIKSGDSYDDRFCLSTDPLPFTSNSVDTTAVYVIESGPILYTLLLLILNKEVKKLNLFSTSDPLSEDLNSTQFALLQEIRKIMTQIPPHSVFFNFECCAGFSESGFGPNQTLQPTYTRLIAHLLTHSGIICLFSDFSLKALIAQWPSRQLGPCPFVAMGQFADELVLSYLPSRLGSCGLEPLQKLGKMTEDVEIARIELLVQKETILYTLRQNAENIVKRTEQRIMERKQGRARKVEGPYELEVLTVANYFNSGEFTKKALNLANESKEMTLCILDEKNFGLAGHTVLTFPSGGKLYACCAHLKDLTRVPTTERSFLTAVEGHYGEQSREYQHVLKRIRLAKTGIERSQTLNDLSLGFVKDSVLNH